MARNDIYDMELDDSHDVFLRGPDLALVNEWSAVKQKLSIRLQFLAEEWFLDNQAGVPYTQQIFEAKTTIQDIYGIFQREILMTPGVESLQSLDLTPDTDARSLQISFRVNDGIQENIEVQL